MLGNKLFDRIKQKLVPTSAATLLFRECSAGLNQIEQVLTLLKSGEDQFAGTVRIGMPIEFGKNVIMPLLAEYSKKHPMVKFKLKLGFTYEMNEKLLNADIDFAFIDSFSVDKRIELERVYDEILGLYILKDAVDSPEKQSHHTRKFYESMSYVEYQECEPILKKWVDHHLGAKHLNLNVNATVMDVKGIARLILFGMGAGVLPDHLVSHLAQVSKQKLHRFEGSGSDLTNTISIAYLRERTHSPISLSLMDYIKKNISRVKM
jgi:DNA-binding transcriptional LysR family regulator